MYSFLLLLSLWLFLSFLLARDSRSGSDLCLVPLAFTLACIVQFNLGYLLISLLHVPRQMNQLLSLAGSIFVTASFVLLKERRATVQSNYKNFFFPAGTIILKSSNSAEKLLRNVRFSMVALAIVAMVIKQALMPTVHNWDANWYNLSRIPAMIASRSIFPEATPSPYQILHPLTHDLLYLTDILNLNLRGMGLIAVIEFFVILGCLYQITLFLFAGFSEDQQGVRVQISLLLVTVLFLTSDLQVLQAAEPKNDLVIVMCFVICLMLALNRSLKRNEPLVYFLMMMTVFAYSISSKSYGVIVLIPPLVSIVVNDLQESAAQRFSLLKKNISFDCLRILKKEKVLTCFVLINMALLLFSFIDYKHLAQISIRADELSKIELLHINATGTIQERLAIFGLNTIRNATSFLLYPYTTLLKLNAAKPDDYLLGFGPLNPILNDPRGMLNAAPVVRNIKADAAYTSIFFLPLLMVSACYYYFYRLPRLPASFRTDSAILILSCMCSFVILSYVLLSQSFSSKFMGSTYVPLISLLSLAVVQFANISKKISTFALALMTAYAIFRLMFLLDIAKVASFAEQVLFRPDVLAIEQSGNLFYYQYAASRYTPEEARIWLSSLTHLPRGKIHVFCYGSETASLTPLMYGIQSLNIDQNLDLRLASQDDCQSSKKLKDDKKINKIFLY